ncbi:ATP-grasp ribosomal peptide maturase [Streptomyces sp. 4503]|uniref:ATP-grasp ribosomal peptide maturase n=1 Tax=Streptomyces niphimycinicus TaxID=2842201 RepID=A0ABS6CN09_9ACTN|nr:ATP-grasp ribosomal peptide maturase [Streptomyces niphimycinicus]MBU3868141.1 ATP-grasp ribosomal peptide maturase [Streptomyces niphimycinicus]
MTVLVLTRPTDATADLVIAELNDRSVPVHRLDPGDFPESLSMAARIGPDHMWWEGALRGQHRDLSLTDVRSVYYRRPSAHRLHPDMSEQDARWADAEARAGFGGLVAALPCPWVNPPQRNALAALPPATLATALRSGLSVPRTLITNDPVEARVFVSALPGQVAAYKALGTTHPSDHEDRPQALWTTQVRPAEIDDSVRRTAHQYAALDFLVSPQGRWYLIDVNPNGQWGFIPDLRTPITRALADLLERAHT